MSNQSTINLRLLCWIYLHWVHLLNTPLHWSASSEHREKADLQLKLNTNNVLPQMARLKEINICIGCICQASLHCVYIEEQCVVPQIAWLGGGDIFALTPFGMSLFFSPLCYLSLSSLWAKFDFSPLCYLLSVICVSLFCEQSLTFLHWVICYLLSACLFFESKV